MKAMVAKVKSNMTNKQFNKHLEELDLSVVGSSDYIGISRRQAQRISAGHSPVPVPVAKLLRAVRRYEISPDDLLEL